MTNRPAEPHAAPADRLGTTLRLGLYGLILVSPLPFGSVEPGAVMLFEVWAAVLGGLALWNLSREMPLYSVRTRRVGLLFGLLLVIGVLQLAPVPQAVVRWVAPTTAQLREQVYALVPQARPGWTALSLSPPDTVDALLRLTAYGLVALAALVALRRPRHLVQAATVVACAALFQGLYGSFEYLSGRQHIFGYVKKYYLEEATGTFINRNHFAGYLALSIPLVLGLLLLPTPPRPGVEGWRRKLVRFARGEVQLKLFAAVAIFVIWIGILLSSSRGGLAAGLIASLAVAWALPQRRRRVALVALLLLVPTAFLMYMDVQAPGERLGELEQNLASEVGRLPVWRATARIAADYPLLGSGYGTFEDAFLIYRPPPIRNRWTHAHNDWLESTAGGGLLVPLIVVGILVLLLRDPPRRFPAPTPAGVLGTAAIAAVLAAAAHAIVDFGLRIPALAILLAVIVGMRLASIEVQQARNNGPLREAVPQVADL